MEYEICEATSTQELRSKVLRMVADGWTPMGGVTFDHANAFDTKAHQAMTRAPKPEPATQPQPIIEIVERRCCLCRLFLRKRRKREAACGVVTR